MYNGDTYLAESIESILCQTYENFELIISDNASMDSTPDICRHYAQQDSRVRYVRQPYNIGSAANHNFVIEQARGALIKTASHDDLYAPDLLRRCVNALDEHPQVVLAHSWSAVIDSFGVVTRVVDYPVTTDAPRAPDRFRSMLLDGWGDDEGGIVRADVLRRTPLHRSYHFADRTFTAELALHGPFHMVPDWLYFRREHPGQSGKHRTVRSRCAVLDPRRANRVRHPVARLYAEYLWAYVSAVHRAPLSPGERRECYRHLARWMAGRAGPVVARSLSRSGLSLGEPEPAVSGPQPVTSFNAIVTGRQRGAP